MKYWCYSVILLATGIFCGNKFICDDGTEIEIRQTCDGIPHCPDKSDEVKKLCFHIMCSPDSFRCHYGACVHKHHRCDGQSHCADGSDEHHCGKEAGSCEFDEFKCQSGQCIKSRFLCDGKPHCNDDSDEYEDICADIICPRNSYHCKVGGCVSFNQTCNGYNDCVDGSDESEVLCKTLKCSGNQCTKIYKQINCPPIKSTRIISRCQANLSYKKGVVPCEKPVPIGTIATYQCRPYYIPSSPKHYSNREMICQPDGTWNKEILKCKPDCGKADLEVLPLITNGWIVKEGKYPWHAVIYELESGRWTFICGGSLISEKVVLTAAHCTWSTTEGNIKVALGKHSSAYGKKENYSQIFEVAQIIRQPLYQDFIGNYGSDIAFLVLKRMVEFSPMIRPICIDWTLDDISDHLTNNSLGLVVGMGLTEKRKFSDELKATYLPVISDEECIKTQSKDFKKYITFTSFCAGWRNGSGVCNGDSGGGLAFPSLTNPNIWVLQGIVSISPRLPGTSFCDPNYYTVFTKVGMYVQWIYKVLVNIHLDEMHDPFTNNVIF